MIYVQTLVNIADNSGGKVARCLKIFKKGIRPRYGKLGDFVIVSIQRLRNRYRLTSKVKKGEVLRGIIIKVKVPSKRLTGISFNFQQNAVVLVDKQGSPLGSRVLGVIPREFKTHKLSKILSLGAGIV